MNFSKSIFIMFNIYMPDSMLNYVTLTSQLSKINLPELKNPKRTFFYLIIMENATKPTIV